MKIGVLDDDPALVAHIEQIMIATGHRCQTFQSGRKLMNCLHHETFDLLILDWNVPDLSGIVILKWIREQTQRPVPVLLVTSRSAEEDVVEGLSAGADDYIVKPVNAAILVARVEAILRRAYPSVPTTSIEEFGQYLFDSDSETVSFDGSAATLTSKEFQLALMLFRNEHRTLSRTYLLENLWGRLPDLPTRTLDAHISKVRTKLNLRPENGYKLAPVYAYGYRLEQVTGGAS